MTPRVAVLTGDLIGSTEVAPEIVESAMAVLAGAAEDIAHWQSTASATRFTRFRGDGWQFALISDPWLALRAAIVVRARLRAASLPVTRIAIGFGTMNFCGSADLSDARGSAFEHSGRGLDTMRSAGWLTIAGDNISHKDQIIADLIDWQMTRWTPEQAEAAARYLGDDGVTLAEIGRALSISAQAVGYRLAGIGATQLRRDLRIWEEEMEFAPEAGR